MLKHGVGCCHELDFLVAIFQNNSCVLILESADTFEWNAVKLLRE